MKLSEFRESLSLAEALTFVAKSEFISSLLKKEGYNPSSFDFDLIIKVVADNIHRNLIE